MEKKNNVRRPNCRAVSFVNHEPNETSMYGSCVELSSKMLLTPLNLLQGVFHIRKLPVANLTKGEFSSKTLIST